MGQPDLTVRFLAEHCLPDLLPTLLPDRRVSVIRVERTKIKLLERDSDEVVHARVDGVRSIFHVEFAIRHERNLPARVLAYNGLLRVRHHPLPVFSMVVYLMPRAPRTPVPTGMARRDSDPQVDFRYPVFCPWRQALTVEDVRRQPQLAPLAVLTPGIGKTDLAALRDAILEREDAKPPELLTLTYLMAGRRFARDLLDSFLRSREMEDSSTYRALMSEGESIGLVKGRADGLRRAVFDFLEARLGRVPARAGRALGRFDADALDGLFKQLLRADGVAEIRALLPKA